MATTVTLVCDECGIEFQRPINQVHDTRHVFCSQFCMGQYRTCHQRPRQGKESPNWKLRAILVCEACGKQFQVKRKHKEKEQRFCSRKCSGEWLRGENSPRWEGGKTSESYRIRRGTEYRIWRTAVFVRDDYTCQDCGQRGVDLRAHHVFSFADFPEHQLEVWNGVTLCRSCHARAHNLEDRVLKARKAVCGW